MKIETKLIDVVGAYFWLSTSDRVLVFIRIIFMLFICLIAYKNFNPGNIQSVVVAIWLGLSAGLGLLLVFDVFLILLIQVFCFFSGRLNDSQISLEDRGILEEINATKRGIYWDDVKKLSITKHHIFIRFGPSYKGEVLVLPCRCFQTKQNYYDYFIKLLNSQKSKDASS